MPVSKYYYNTQKWGLWECEGSEYASDIEEQRATAPTSPELTTTDMFMLHEDALEAVRQWRREKALDRLVADAQKDGFYDD